MQICEAAWRQRGAASGELEEGFPLSSCHVHLGNKMSGDVTKYKCLVFTHQHVDKLEEAWRVLGVSELGLRVLDDLLPGEHRLLVTT